MDHDATREAVELAAVELGGLERLMAGDTPDSQLVAGHLAGCPTCAEELVRIERASGLVRAALQVMPAADLRERTLAAVRSVGVARDAGPNPARVAILPVVDPAPAPPDTVGLPRPAGAAAPVPMPVAVVGPRRQVIGWIATVAATVVLSVVATSVIVGTRVDSQLADQEATVAALEEVTTSTLSITAEPDAEHVALTGTTDPTLDGSLAFSPATTELVVVVTGLTPPPAGQEYGCWVEVDGKRQRVGKMFFSDDLAYWVGPAPAVAGLSGAATFGISLVELGGSGAQTVPVLTGEL